MSAVHRAACSGRLTWSLPLSTWQRLAIVVSGLQSCLVVKRQLSVQMTTDAGIDFRRRVHGQANKGLPSALQQSFS